jgi:hypothetical protein
MIEKHEIQLVNNVECEGDILSIKPLRYQGIEDEIFIVKDSKRLFIFNSNS